MYYKNKNIKSSFKYFEESIKLNPENYILLNNYSYYLSLEKTNFQRAEELILKVIAKFPNVANLPLILMDGFYFNKRNLFLQK